MELILILFFVLCCCMMAFNGSSERVRDGLVQAPQERVRQDGLELEQALEESANMIQSNPENFISDDLSAEEIMRLFEQREESHNQTAETATELAQSNQTIPMTLEHSTDSLQTRLPEEPISLNESNQHVELSPSAPSEREMANNNLLESLSTNVESMTTSGSVRSNLTRLASELTKLNELTRVLSELAAASLRADEHNSQAIESNDSSELAIESITNPPCAICLDELDAIASQLVSPSCGHTFHENCLCDWFSQLRQQGRRDQCPMCRLDCGRNLIQ